MIDHKQIFIDCAKSIDVAPDIVCSLSGKVDKLFKEAGGELFVRATDVLESARPHLQGDNKERNLTILNRYVRRLNWALEIMIVEQNRDPWNRDRIARRQLKVELEHLDKIEKYLQDRPHHSGRLTEGPLF